MTFNIFSVFQETDYEIRKTQPFVSSRMFFVSIYVSLKGYFNAACARIKYMRNLSGGFAVGVVVLLVLSS